MMKHPLCAMLLVAMLQTPPAPGGKVYGQGVSLSTGIRVEAALATPEKFVGKTVRVDGIVSAVDPALGVWMEIGNSAGGKRLQVAAREGTVVFPMRLKGRQVAVQGVFEELPRSAMELAEFQVARERAQPPAQAGPPKAYRVRATGAVVY